MYAAWMPPRSGEPWEPWEDGWIREDARHGCTLFVMAQRARRSEAEVRQRMAALQVELREPRRMSRATLARGW